MQQRDIPRLCQHALVTHYLFNSHCQLSYSVQVSQLKGYFRSLSKRLVVKTRSTALMKKGALYVLKKLSIKDAVELLITVLILGPFRFQFHVLIV